MRIIITGANGFIGRHCVSVLSKAGYEVFALCHRLPESKIENVEYVQIDLFDSQDVDHALKKIQATHMLHLAWYVNPDDYMNSSENMKWLIMSVNLLETFVQYGGTRIVTAGTCAEYDWTLLRESPVTINEDFPKDQGTSLYAACKLALGNICNAYMRKRGLTSAHGRIFFLFGPGEKLSRLIPNTILSCVNCKAIVLNNSSYIRDYLYVKDVADAFLHLLESDACGAVNIASGEGIRLLDLVTEIENAFESESNMVQRGPEQPTANGPTTIIANIDKLNKTGWKRKYTLSDALEEYKKVLISERSGGA